jgi:molybdenum cofactor synthesis domain-containing protein
VRAAVLTISSSRSEAEDASGPLLAGWLAELGLELAGTELVADDQAAIEERLVHWADAEDCLLVVTTGGTGFAPDDLTPEATLAVCERQAPGIAEAMRAASRAATPHWMLSRAVAGIRGRTLIVNFPGNPKAIEETAAALSAALPHGLRLLAGEDSGH